MTSSAPPSDREPAFIGRYAAFAGVLASAGIPLYVHLPAFLTQTYGISLATLGGLLITLRCLDFVQDPLLGIMLNGEKRRVSYVTALSTLGLGLGMIGIFAFAAPIPVVAWLAICLAVTFTGFSALTILLYADGVARARSVGHVGLATWREFGALSGILIACILPFLLGGNGYSWFALIFAASLFIAFVLMRGRWMNVNLAFPSLSDLWSNTILRRFLVFAFFNALPVSVTSTLFVFFVEYRLNLPDLTGVFLLLFFLSAATSTILWRKAALRIGAAESLTIGMILAILTFFWAFTLPQGASALFAVICVTSGAALGADMILPLALFAGYQEKQGNSPTLAFGMWSFAQKASLAVAAGVVLPLLAMSDFAPNGQNTQGAVFALGLFYALVPATLKMFAILWLWFVLRQLGH